MMKKNKQELQEKMENALRNMISQLQEEGKSREEAESILEQIFLISNAESKEKVSAYWK